MDLLLSAWADASPLIGLILLLVGGAYLFFGKWLFRVFVAGLGIAAGMELGRVAAAALQIEGPWPPLLVGAVVGALSWPLWQAVVFVSAGGGLALILGEVVHGLDLDRSFYMASVIAGFVLGGMLALVVMRAAAVGISALAGALMILAGVMAVGHGTIPFVSGLADSGVARLIVVIALAGAGIGVQVLLPAAEDARKRRLEKATERAKADDEAESRRRYARYLTRG